MAIAERPFAELVAALAARTPAPGGGAAAACAAALACASGAMAARYSTGPRWAAVAAEATALADALDAAAAACTSAADADADAYATVQAARKAGDTAALAAAEAAALAVPAGLIAACARHAGALAAFRPRCNPNLASDVDVALHLLAGAARAALRTLLVNQPPAGALAAARADLAAVLAAEAAIPA